MAGPAARLWARFLSGPDIDSLALTSAEIIGAVQGALAAQGDGRAVLEPRVHLIPAAGQAGGGPRSTGLSDGIDACDQGHFNVLRGCLPGAGGRAAGFAGVKVVGDFAANYTRGLPSEPGLLTLYDPATGVPEAIMDATLITACRTGAMTAVGAKYLARPGSRVLGHVGSRGTAFWNVVFLDELLELTEIRVTSARARSREAFARELADVIDTPVRVTATAAETFDGADILVEATRLTRPQPLLRACSVGPGALVMPYGTISAVAIDLLDVIDKVVVDDWREAQAGRFGALRAHVDTGRLTARSLHGELAQIVTGALPGRESDGERILFWHRGLAILDIAVGALILRRARDAGVGTMLRYR